MNAIRAVMAVTLVVGVGVLLARPLIIGWEAAAAYAEAHDWRVCGLVIQWPRPLSHAECLWARTARANQESYVLAAVLKLVGLGDPNPAATLQRMVRDSGYGDIYAYSLYALQAALALASVSAAWKLVPRPRPRCRPAAPHRPTASQTGRIPPELKDWD